jgi:transcriptional regulator with XRE-family HTH domain
VISLSDFLNYIGSKIRSARKSRGLTQENLAEKSGLQYTYIGGIERGERNISLQTLEKIINGLDITLIELFSEKIPSHKHENKDMIMASIQDILVTMDEEELVAMRKVLYEIINFADIHRKK